LGVVRLLDVRGSHRVRFIDTKIRNIVNSPNKFLSLMEWLLGAFAPDRYGSGWFGKD